MRLRIEKGNSFWAYTACHGTHSEIFKSTADLFTYLESILTLKKIKILLVLSNTRLNICSASSLDLGPWKPDSDPIWTTLLKPL